MIPAGDYVLDACGLIAFLREEDGWEYVSQLLETTADSSKTVFMHKVTLAEVMYDVFRRKGQAGIDFLFQFIEPLPIKLADDLGNEFLTLVAYFKTSHKISFADSFVLALAKLQNAKVITSDHHEFDTIEQAGELQFEWIR